MRLLTAFLLIAASAVAQTPPQLGGTGALADLPRLKDYTVGRSSSYDRTGGNADGLHDNQIQPKETRTIFQTTGAGAITRFWCTINSHERMHLRTIVVRMYWDGEDKPSVEAPIGDFFGLGLGMVYGVNSQPLFVGPQKSLNSFWHMPFGKGARITITNDGQMPIRRFFYHVDYQKYDALPDDVGRFHAQYRQTYPCVVGKDYVVLEAQGRGHYVGCHLSVETRQDGWWGEGDDHIYVDSATPTIIGTGTEDYFGGAYCYGSAFNSLYLGCPLHPEFNMMRSRGARWDVYRYHIEDPIPFKKTFKLSFEHGEINNERQDNYSSVAYWYQVEPHAPFPDLPSASERMP